MTKETPTSANEAGVVVLAETGLLDQHRQGELRRPARRYLVKGQTFVSTHIFG
jgi:hypothetical protein